MSNKTILKVINVLLLSFLIAIPGIAAGDETLDFDTFDGIDGPGRRTPVNTQRPSQSRSNVKLSSTQVYKKVDPAVVIVIQKIQDKQVAHGSGFVVKDNGFILTNNHVVSVENYGKYANMVELDVVTRDGRHHAAQIVKADPDIDLALIKIDVQDHPYTVMGEAGDIEIGEDVYIIGTPVRLEFSHSITSGIISGMDRSQGRIQTSAIIHGGNSGGPAINDRGEIIGVAVAVALGFTTEHIAVNGKMQPINVSNQKIGISYLVPINYAKNLLNLVY